MSRPGCEAISEADELVCHTCGFRWGLNDPDPPECRPTQTHTLGHAVPPRAPEPAPTRPGPPPNTLDAKCEYWRTKDRSVGRAYLTQLREKLADE